MKKLLLLCLFVLIHLWANAQATDLVIDCQTPGWLSSKINYGDQQTVKNLKVTGYINDEDLRFIGSLTQLNLNGVVDLGEANIIGNTWCGAFKHNKEWSRKTHDWYIKEYDYAYHLQKLVLPKSLETYIEETFTGDNQEVDTLVFDTQISSIKNGFYRKIGHLQLGENIDSIKVSLGHSMKSAYLPSALKYLNGGFKNALTNVSHTNISEFPSLEYMGNYCFVNDYKSTPGTPSNKETLPNSINLPQIKEFYITAFDYKENMHIYLGEELESLYYEPDIRNTIIYWQPNIDNVFFHLKTSTPPQIFFANNNGAIVLPYGLRLCIPTGSKEAYEEVLNSKWSLGKYYTLIEEDVLLEHIRLTPAELSMEVGEKTTIEATLLPSNVTDKTIIWSVENEKIVKVSQAGEVEAISSGETEVYAASPDCQIKGICKVNVKAHEESVGILEIQRDPSDSDPVYDIMGRKVKALTKGQLYISNGKKFICR